MVMGFARIPAAWIPCKIHYPHVSFSAPSEQRKRMTDRESSLDKILNIAEEQLRAVDNDPSKLNEPYRTVAIISAAQGVIDNGGLEYFFAADWPSKPPYSLFSDAYRRIGKREAAEDIENAAASFGIECPEQDRELRRQFIENQFGGFDENGHETAGLNEFQWTDRICGDDSVWDALADWIKENVTASSSS